jgi:hypothetical protein
MIHTNHRPIRRNHLDFQIVDFPEFAGLSRRGSRHPAGHGIESDEILQRNRTENPALFFWCDTFFCFDCGVKASGPAAILNDAAFEFVDGFNGAILHQIVDVAPEQGMRVDGVLDGSMKLEVLRIEKIAAVKRGFDLR